MGKKLICVPKDWEGIKRISVTLSYNQIVVQYIGDKVETETWPFSDAVTGEDGVTKLIGTPFSYMSFSASGKMILSRAKDNSRRGFTYLLDPQ